MPLAGGETEVVAQAWGASALTTSGDTILFTRAAQAAATPAAIASFSDARGVTSLAPAYAVDLAVVGSFLYAAENDNRELIRFPLSGSGAAAGSGQVLATGVEEVESDGNTLYYVEITRRTDQPSTSRLLAVRQR